MNYRVLIIAFFLLFFAGMLWTAQQRIRTDLHLKGTEVLIQDMAGPQESLSQASKPLPHTTLIGSKGEIDGYIFFTKELAPDIKGYGGEIPMVVKVDAKGQIKAVRVLENNETSPYTGDLNVFVQKFLGKTHSDQLEIGKDIDGITGATISSDAIARTIKKSLAVFAEKVLAAEPVTAPLAKPFPWGKVVASLFVFVLCLIAVLSAESRLRWVALTAGFVYFGIMTSTMLSIVQVANISLLNIPNFLANPLWWLTLAFAFTAALIIGRAHCASVCPFALVQETLHKFMRHRPTAPKVDPRLDRRARYLKYLFLLAIIVSAPILGNASAANVEPFVTLFNGHGTKIAWMLLIFMLILSIFHYRFWCVYLCPVGSLTGLISRLSVFKVKLKDRCSLCKNCANICPVQAISYLSCDAEHQAQNESYLQTASNNQVVVDESECILCGRCIKGCPEGKLSLRSRYEKK